VPGTVLTQVTSQPSTEHGYFIQIQYRFIHPGPACCKIEDTDFCAAGARTDLNDIRYTRGEPRVSLPPHSASASHPLSHPEAHPRQDHTRVAPSNQCTVHAR
jgi:hypothetical protein